jgi:hypothetical protein
MTATGTAAPVSDGDGRLRHQRPTRTWRGTRTMSTDTNDTSEQPERAPGPPPDDPIRWALQYRWLSTDRWLDLGLGLPEHGLR